MGPKEISGFEGDTVSLQCTYQEELRAHRKYWCRESGFFLSRCSGTIYAGEDGQEMVDNRVSIQDSPQTLTLHVTLRKLTLKDAGKYYCGVSKLGPDEAFLVTLLVFPGNASLCFPAWGAGDTEGKRDRWGAEQSRPRLPLANRYSTCTNLLGGLKGSVRWCRSSARPSW